MPTSPQPKRAGGMGGSAGVTWTVKGGISFRACSQVVVLVERKERMHVKSAVGTSRLVGLSALVMILLVGSIASARRQRPVDGPPMLNGRPFLPAWETEWERRMRLQKDTYNQLEVFRNAHPELYGITEAPVQPVTFYAEFDPVDAVYHAWEPGTFDRFFFDFTHEILARTSAEVYILHHGDGDKQAIETYVTNQGDDPAEINFIDVSTLGAYYVWQTEWPYDRSLESFWTVDYGPYFVEDGDGVLSIVDPRYYFGRINDDAIPAKLGSLLGVNVFRPDVDWEGGNLFSDGAGTCFSTGIHIAENLPQTQAQIEDHMLDFFGCQKVIWLKPLLGEGTGHIDMFFKNASATTILLGEFDPADDDVNAAVLEENLQILQNETNAAGDSFDILRVPMPAPDPQFEFFRTYMNGIIVNEIVLVPVFPDADEHEAAALSVFETAFPDKTVVPIDSTGIIDWGGSIHCVTRTRPVGSHQTVEPAPDYACNEAWQCATGCGEINFTGDCVWGYPVFCEDGALLVEVCWHHERCGWDLQGGYFYCVTQGCSGLAAEGECRTAEGDTIAVWCSEEGYPMGERCPSGTECAVSSITGHMGCLVVCDDDCDAGEVGCEGDHRWYCGEADDGDECLEQITVPCGSEETCQAGACVCVDMCTPGEAICDGDGNVVTCGESGDGDDCLEPVTIECEEGSHCRDATCVPDTTSGGSKKGCGCRSSTAPTSLPILFVLFALAGLGLWSGLGSARSRRSRRRR